MLAITKKIVKCAIDELLLVSSNKSKYAIKK
jgi:hypothetical protein